MKVYLLFLFILFSSTCLNIYGQISFGGKPFSMLYQSSTSGIPIIDMPEIDTISLKSSEENNFYKSKAFTQVFDVNINPDNSGIWITLDNGIKIWRVGIRSRNAYSILINIEPFQLPEGAKLYIYNENYRYTLGAYTHKNNRKSKIFPIEPVPGELAFIELILPKENKSNYLLNINRVGHDYLNFFNILENNNLSQSGECNYDINCIDDTEFQQIKNATFLYIYYHTIEKKDKYCNGTLINNSRQNGKPYFLTAGHCVWDSVTAASVVAFFDYESYYCNGPAKDRTKTISGAEFVANVNKLDFGLAMFPDLPPFSYKPYFAGWNHSDENFSNVACIHHPLGDVKKVSLDYDEIDIASYSAEYDNNSFFRINRWDVGTTEGGSSGGPLYDSEKRIIGTLTGGDADCDKPVNDYFTRFSFAWDKYPEPKEQLKYWLDPDNTGIYYIDGYDPYQIFKDSCDTTSVISENTVTTLLSLDDGWGFWTGHNSEKITQYAQKIEIGNNKQLTGVVLNIAFARQNSEEAEITIKAWTDENDKPGIPIIEKSMMLNYFNEALNFVEFDTIVLLNSDIFIGYELSYQVPRDTFALYQTDQITQQSLNYFVFQNNSWQRIDIFTDYTIESSLDIRVILCDSLPLQITPPSTTNKPNLEIFPNPATQYLIINFGDKELSGNSQIQLFDITGKQIHANIHPYAFNKYYLNVSDYPAGMYLISVLTDNKRETKRFLILK